MNTKALLGLLRKEIYHILRDQRTLLVIIAAAGAAGDHLRLRDSDRRRPRAARDRRSGARPRDAGAPQPVHARPACSPWSRSLPRSRRSSRCSSAATRRRRSSSSRASPSTSPAACRRAAARHRRHRAEYRQRRPGLRAAVIAGLRARAAAPRRARPHRARGPHALQPDARELEPVRARADGVRPDDHLVADDGDLADAREGDRHDGGAARLAAAALADHRRQGRALSRGRLHQRASA